MVKPLWSPESKTFDSWIKEFIATRNHVERIEM